MTLKKSAKKYIKNKLPAELQRRREFKRRKAIREKKQKGTATRDDAKPAARERDQGDARAQQSDKPEETRKAKPKKPVEEMTADEFMEKGFFEALDADSEGSDAGDEDEAAGSDGDEGEEEAEALAGGEGEDDDAEMGDGDEEGEGELSEAAAAAAADGKKIKGKVAQHRKVRSLAQRAAGVLEDLASKDPEFYEFLKKNDANLLHFGEDIGDDEGEEEEEEEEESEEEEEEKPAKKKKGKEEGKAEKGKKKGKKGEEEEEAEAEAEAEAEKEKEAAKGAVLTTEMLTQWIRAARATKSHKALARVVRAFRAGCRVADPEGADDDGRAPELHIPSAGVFNRLMAFCFGSFDGLLDAHLGRPAGDAHGTEGGATGEGGARPGRWSPGQSPQWKKSKPLVKSYVTHALRFLGQVADGSMAALVLRQMARMVPYVALWPALGRKLLKAALVVWSGGGGGGESERARVAAYLLMRQVRPAPPRTA
eukprot:tig00020610_g12016.t1